MNKFNDNDLINPKNKYNFYLLEIIYLKLKFLLFKHLIFFFFYNNGNYFF